MENEIFVLATEAPKSWPTRVRYHDIEIAARLPHVAALHILDLHGQSEQSAWTRFFFLLVGQRNVARREVLRAL